jgi:hypothetical protein
VNWRYAAPSLLELLLESVAVELPQDNFYQDVVAAINE